MPTTNISPRSSPPSTSKDTKPVGSETTADSGRPTTSLQVENREVIDIPDIIDIPDNTFTDVPAEVIAKTLTYNF